MAIETKLDRPWNYSLAVSCFSTSLCIESTHQQQLLALTRTDVQLPHARIKFITHLLKLTANYFLAQTKVRVTGHGNCGGCGARKSEFFSFITKSAAAGFPMPALSLTACVRANTQCIKGNEWIGYHFRAGAQIQKVSCEWALALGDRNGAAIVMNV